MSSPRKTASYLFLILSAYLLLISPELFTRSMFMDGIYYASIARNLAEGLGSCWVPHFTETHFPEFYEHPPFAFWSQSVFFRLFGDAFWVERVYSLSMVLLSGVAITRVWKELAGKSYQHLQWTPILFALSIPLFWWAAPNNVLENTLSPLLLFSVLFMLKSLRQRRFLYLLFATTLLFFGTLTKGPVALFPLSFFFWAFCFQKASFTRMLGDAAFLLLVLGGAYLAVFTISSEAYGALKTYVIDELITGVTSRETVDSRFYIVERLFGELIPAFLLGGIVLLLGKGKKFGPEGSEGRKEGGMMLALGLSGVLPMMITKTQGGFYLLPALPYFCLGLALLLLPMSAPLIRRLNERKGGRWIRWSASVLLLMAFVSHTYHFGKLGKDKERIALVRAVDREVDTKMIGIHSSMRGKFGLHAYFQRIAGISLDREGSNEFLLFPKEKGEPAGYEPLSVKNGEYRLFKRR